jgi:formate hydrogenlyase transcriptional activator
MSDKLKLSNLEIAKIILDSMPGNAYILNEEGRIMACNRHATEVYGYTEEEFLNRSVLDFIDKVDHEKIINTMANSQIGKIIWVENTAVIKNGKKIPYLASATTIFINGKKYYIGLGVDISELASARKKIIEKLVEITRLNELLQAENIYLKNQLELSGQQFEMVGESEAIKYLLFKIKQVAPTDASVIIEGETGTGKELVARAIHGESKRKDNPFVKVNCASIPENLIESELFGHEKGAFTSAVEKRIGRFEIANGGTIFLDEIGELPMSLQPKLLHILQQGEFERIGSSKTIKTDVRIIAATNKVLEDEIKKGKFRNDLYYRLNVFPITVVPLRERKTDILLLAEYYIKIFAEKFNKTVKAISKKSMQQMMSYTWPGNIRELINVIERAIITSQNQILNIEPLPKTDFVSKEFIPLEELEKNYITSVLEKTYWKISGPGGAASLLRINPETLRSKMRKLSIKRTKTE